MALLNGMYIFVSSESPISEIETVAHPVEKGINVTDHVRRKPKEITLEGEVVGESAKDIIEQLTTINQKGIVVTYVGAYYFKNGQIIRFDWQYTNQINGGCSFTMVLREVRFAQNSFTASASAEKENSPAAQASATNRPTNPTTQAGLQQRTYSNTNKTVSHTVKNGETDYTIAQEYKSQGAALRDIKQQYGDLSQFGIGEKFDVGTRKGKGY